jgi:hypothetical protein
MAIKTYTDDEFIKRLPERLQHTRGQVQAIRAKMPEWARDCVDCYESCVFDPEFLVELEQGTWSCTWRHVLTVRAWSCAFWLSMREESAIADAVDEILACPDEYPHYLIRDADELRGYFDGSSALRSKHLRKIVQ